MGAGELVTLKCQPEVLAALASDLTGFAAADGAPDWLVSGVWLFSADDRFIATSSVEVLADGYVARPLNLHRPDELALAIEAELSDVLAKLKSRGSAFQLPHAAEPLAAPKQVRRWEGKPSMSVLLRVCQRASVTHRVACALLFEAEGGRALLVGTDVSTLAMVLSEDRELIGRYRAGCDEMSADAYLALANG